MLNHLFFGSFSRLAAFFFEDLWPDRARSPGQVRIRTFVRVEVMKPLGEEPAVERHQAAVVRGNV